MASPTPEGRYSISPICSRKQITVFDASFPDADKTLTDWVRDIISQSARYKKDCVEKEGSECPKGCAVAGLARMKIDYFLRMLIEAGKYDDQAGVGGLIINSPRGGNGDDK